MGVAETIKRIIDEKGLKQKTIAEKAGFSETGFSDLLNGRKTFKVEYLDPVCKALDTTPDEILGYSATPGKP
jgi:DNA-binding Xre family transcriptional regulator